MHPCPTHTHTHTHTHPDQIPRTRPVGTVQRRTVGPKPVPVPLRRPLRRGGQTPGWIAPAAVGGPDAGSWGCPQCTTRAVEEGPPLREWQRQWAVASSCALGLWGRRAFCRPPVPPPPPRVTFRRVHRALDSHPVVPSRAASGRCGLTVAAARGPAGVVFAGAWPSGRRTGGCAGGCDPPPPPRGTSDLPTRHGLQSTNSERTLFSDRR